MPQPELAGEKAAEESENQAHDNGGDERRLVRHDDPCPVPDGRIPRWDPAPSDMVVAQ